MSIAPASAADGSEARARVRRRASRHSLVVKAYRILLPVVMLAILAVLGVIVGRHAARSHASAPRETPTQIRMINPHFFGRDDQGRAFTFSARQAVRDDNDMQQVLLTGPVITLDVDGVHPTTMISDRGVYREDTRLLRLMGHVRADDAKQSTASTEDALIDTRAGTITGGKAVDTRTAMAQVQGGSFTASQRGDRVIFRGGVHARLNTH